MNAVIYARYSSDKQTEQSIEGQLRDCLAYAERHNLKVVGEYIDRAQSGTTAKREQFQKMISDSKSKQFCVVLVYKFDRFARNMYDSAVYEHKLEQNGVRVISVTEQVGEGNEALIVKAVLRAMAELYSKQLGENVRRGMRESALKANSTGGTLPLGYKVENKKLVADSKTAGYVRFIFEQYAAGAQKRQIIRDLTAKGYKRPNGNPITIQNLTYILSNIKYTGTFKYNDTIIENGCPALVSKELFQACQERSQREARFYGRKAHEKADFLLVGKLFCGLCGKPMSGCTGTSRNGEKHHYYACYTHKNRSRFNVDCKKQAERKGFIEWYVVQQTVQYVLEPNRKKYIAERMVSEYKKLFDNSKIREMEFSIKSIEKEMANAVEALLRTDNKFATDMINEKLSILELQKQDAEIELSKLRIASEIMLTEQDIMNWLDGFCLGDSLDETFQRHIIDAFINSIFLYDDKIVIYYNVKGSEQISYLDMLKQTDQLADDNGETKKELEECSSSSMNGSPCWT